MRTGLMLVVVGVVAGAAWADPVTFTAGPTVRKTADGATVAFAVSAPTDVEVAVLNAKGEAVRHLAAGVLGGQTAPPAPLKAGLDQALTWDGTDDAGAKAAGAPFTIRVRAGMQVGLDAILGGSPYAIARIRGLACDGQGTLYLVEQAYDGHFPGPYYLKVFDRQGDYLRTLMPFRADLPKAGLDQFQLIDSPDPWAVPRNHYSVWPCLYPYQYEGFKLSPTVLADGTLLCHDESFRRVFLVQSADGAPVAGKFGASIWPRDVRLPRGGGSPVFAATPDGKTVYVTGFGASPPKDARVNEQWPDGRVYRLSLDRLGEGAEPFATVDLPEKCPAPAGGWTPDVAVSALTGIDVDANGNVYVCDHANGQVRKFSPAGKELGAVGLPNAYQAAVSDKTGAVYVVTCPVPGRRGEKTLVKLAGCEADAKVVATLQLGSADCAPFIALDETGEKPQVWVAAPGLLRIRDDGAVFTVVEDLRDRADPLTTLAAVDKLTVDPVTHDLYVNNGWNRTVRLNGLTGRYTGPIKDGRPDPMVVTDTAVGADGYVYVQQGPSYSGPLVRLDRDLQPAPPEGQESAKVGHVYGRYGAGYCEKGHCIAADGTLFSLSMYNWAKYFVCAYDKTGKAIEGRRLVGEVKAKEPVSAGVTSGVIGPVPAQCGGIRVDREGFLYLGVAGLPPGTPAPAGFEKDEAYRSMIGSVVKFKPTGGGLAAEKEAEGLRLTSGVFEGAVMAYPGLAGFSRWRRSDACVCRTPRFDLDPFGRLYLPNTLTCSMKVVDNAGNEILTAGRYGNFDNQGGRGDAREPAIPFGWPLSVGVAGDTLYVGDMLNRRVLRLKTTYAAEETCRLE